MLLAPPFTIRSYTVVNGGGLSVFILDGLGNIIDVIDPGETSSANSGAVNTLSARFAAATTGSANIILSDERTTPASSYTPGFGPSSVLTATAQIGSPVSPNPFHLFEQFAYSDDIYDLLWWRCVLLNGSGTQGYSAVVELLDPLTGNVLDVDVANSATPGILSSYPARAAGHDFAVGTIQRRMPPPNVHWGVNIGPNNAWGAANTVNAIFSCGIRRRTFTDG